MDSILLDMVRKANQLENIGEPTLHFLIDELIAQQGYIIEQMINGNIQAEQAKERIKAIRWLIKFISTVKRQGESAREHLEKGV